MPMSENKPVKFLSIEKLFNWTLDNTREPPHLTQVTHVPHGGGVGGAHHGDDAK